MLVPVLHDVDRHCVEEMSRVSVVSAAPKLTPLLPEREHPNTPAEIPASVKAELAGTVFKEKRPGPEAAPLLTV
jgi:hypothetical protein